MEIHYCMGKKASVDFYSAREDRCGKCGMKEKKGCCSDEHKFYKLENSHKSVSNDISFNAGEVAIINTSYPQYDWQLPAQQTVAFATNHSPPDYNGPSACIMNCVFRI